MAFTPLVVDVSHHNGTVDWHAIADAGVVGAFIKLTEGWSLVDDRALENWHAAHEAGIRPAFYHYLHHGNIGDQVENFVSAASVLPGMPMAIDFEEPGLDMEDLLDAVDGFQSAGLRVAVYGSALLKEVIGNDVYPELAETALWIAQYRDSDPTWPTQVWATWTFHQYTDGAVGGEPMTLPGLPPMDLNRFNGTRANCIRWFRIPITSLPRATITVDFPINMEADVVINGITYVPEED